MKSRISQHIYTLHIIENCEIDIKIALKPACLRLLWDLHESDYILLKITTVQNETVRFTHDFQLMSSRNG